MAQTRAEGQTPPAREEGRPQELRVEVGEHDGPTLRESYFVIKIFIPGEYKAKLREVEAEKNHRYEAVRAREETPEYQAMRRKYEEFERQDERAKLRQRAEDPLIGEVEKRVAEMQKQKMRYMFKVFEGFEGRGKAGGIRYDHSGGAEGWLSIRINKHYFVHELGHSRKELITLPWTFLDQFKGLFGGMVRTLWKFYLQTEKSQFFTMLIRSIDLISITFDIRFNDMRTYRIRWSPFEFRPTLINKNDFLLGYYQSFSLIQETKGGSTLLKEEFYNAQKLFFLDDLTDDKSFSKIAFRINLFHQMYCISRSVVNLPTPELEEWGKKCHGQFYYSTTRLKKFSFTFPIRPFRRTKSRKEQFNKLEAKLELTFLCDKEIEVTDTTYSLVMQLHDWSGTVHPSIKEEVHVRLKDWYILAKEAMARERVSEMLWKEEQPYLMARARIEHRQLELEDFKMPIRFTSRDRFERFFLGAVLIASAVIDRHYFCIYNAGSRYPREETKVEYLDTASKLYVNRRQEYLEHHHYIRVLFKHSFSQNMVSLNPNSHEEKTSLVNFFMSKSTDNVRDYRMRCGSWSLDRIIKVRQKVNKKTEKEVYEPETQEVTSFPDVFKQYIGILLHHFPLRMIYKDIIDFVERVGVTCYGGQEDTVSFEHNRYEHVFRIVIDEILKHYYFNQLERRQKPKEEKEERAKAEEKPHGERKPEKEDHFSKVVVLRIITKDDTGWVEEDKLLGEVTFRIMYWKYGWQTLMRDGFCVVRVFEDRVEFERQYVKVMEIRGEWKKKTLDRKEVQIGIEKCSHEFRASLAL